MSTMSGRDSSEWLLSSAVTFIEHGISGSVDAREKNSTLSNTAFSNAVSPQLIPEAAYLAPSLPSEKLNVREARWVTLQTKQLWEGTVTEIEDDGFGAVLVDRTNAGNPDEIAQFDFSGLSDADRKLLRVGSPFYLIVGTEKTVYGQVKNVAFIHMRRLAPLTRRAVSEARQRAESISELFG